MSLSETRRHQLRRARAALAKGNRAEAAAHFFEGIDEFLLRLDRVLAKNDLPRLPLRERNGIAWQGKLEACRMAREEVRKILTRKPETPTAQIAARLGCSNDMVYLVRKEMGLPSLPKGRNLCSKLKQLLAEAPQITNKEAAHRLNCTLSSIRRCRLELGFSYKPRWKPVEPRKK
jgi:hypothetical protein